MRSLPGGRLEMSLKIQELPVADLPLREMAIDPCVRFGWRPWFVLG